MGLVHLIDCYGFDPSLRHGCLVRGSFLLDQDQPQPSTITGLEVMFAWDKKSPLSLSEKSSPAEVYALSQATMKALTQRDYPRTAIAVDWDPYSVFWRNRKLQMVQMAYFIGYFTRAAHSLGFPVVYISPSEVRRRLRIKAASGGGPQEKGVLQEWFRRSAVVRDLDVSNLLRNSDTCDAAILAYLLAKAHVQQAVTSNRPVERLVTHEQ